MHKNVRSFKNTLATCLLVSSSLALPSFAQQPIRGGAGAPATAGARPQAGATGKGQPAQATGARPGGGFQTQPIQTGRAVAGQQPVAQQGAQPNAQASGQGQLPQGQLPQGQLPQGQLPQGQPGQAGAQAALNPAQAAAVLAAQQQQVAGGGVNPVAPFPPLNKQWADFLEKVLDKWELESSKVQKFECKFARFQYDPTLVTPYHNTVATGVLKYMQPDKGLFKVDSLLYYSGTQKDAAGVEQPQFAINKQRAFGEYWICDGQYIHILDQNEKKCIKQQLPPQMRGNAIHLSPLPFVFGVKKLDLQARYWINPLPAQTDRPNEIWLEVFPRRADDASNYQKLQVVLDLKDWMPKGLIVFLPNWRANAPHRELYQFEDRQVNAKNILPQMFQKEFIPEDPPKDWKVIVEPYQAGPAEQPADEPRVATPPQPGAPVLK